MPLAGPHAPPERERRFAPRWVWAFPLAGLAAVLALISASNPPEEAKDGGGADNILWQAQSTGSAFFIAFDGTMATANHVVAKCRSVWVLDGQRAFKARILATDPGLDAALIRSEAPVSRIAAFRFEPVDEDEPLVALGFASDRSRWRGPDARSLAAVASERLPWMLALGAPGPGFSGGPIIDGGGAVRGVVMGEAKLALMTKALGKARPEQPNTIGPSAASLRAFAGRSQIALVEWEHSGWLSSRQELAKATRLIVCVT